MILNYISYINIYILNVNIYNLFISLIIASFNSLIDGTCPLIQLKHYHLYPYYKLRNSTSEKERFGYKTRCILRVFFGRAYKGAACNICIFIFNKEAINFTHKKINSTYFNLAITITSLIEIKFKGLQKLI